MKVLVCGGRDYQDSRLVYRALDALKARGDLEGIVCGDARGADAIAERWAEQAGIPAQVYVADWETHGKAAGPKRNQQMLDENVLSGVVAFPGGRGTADMITRAKSAGLTVWEPAR